MRFGLKSSIAASLLIHGGVAVFAVFGPKMDRAPQPPPVEERILEIVPPPPEPVPDTPPVLVEAPVPEPPKEVVTTPPPPEPEPEVPPMEEPVVEPAPVNPEPLPVVKAPENVPLPEPVTDAPVLTDKPAPGTDGLRTAFAYGTENRPGSGYGTEPGPRREGFGEGKPDVLAVPNYRRSPQPDYPREARRRGEEGIVLLLVGVNDEGKPTAVRIKESSGFSLLDRAALDAVKNWRFQPATKNGHPMACQVEVPIRFDLKKRG